MMGETSAKLVTRYACCYANLMLPLFERIRSDGNTLVIRGTKTADMATVPVRSGEAADGLEVFLPLENWSHDQVFAYLRSVGAPISRVYDHSTNSPECARCSAWWNEKRAAYLREFHPALYEQYAARLHVVAQEISAPLLHLQRELQEIAHEPV